jgi:hypothetical protein
MPWPRRGAAQLPKRHRGEDTDERAPADSRIVREQGQNRISNLPVLTRGTR